MIIGVSGYARVGKDTFADQLVSQQGFTKMSFADPMRKALLTLNPLITLGGSYVPLASAVRMIGWDSLKTESPDVRPLLQRLGTEVGRNMFGDNFWVDLALKEAAKHEDVVFADVRFKNEADAIVDAGGIIVRVIRDGFGPANDHISEVDMDDYICKHRVNNSSSIDDLAVKATILVAAERSW
jgi:hypothetical protein